MTPFRPYTIARYGVYLAIAVAAMSIWLGQRAGASLDYSLLRAVFVFVIFTALAFGAEAVFTVGWQPPPPKALAPPTQTGPEDQDE
ncbi:MAG: hypothetical protein ACM3S1_09170 [Hyphomicrobiales bacterium]